MKLVLCFVLVLTLCSCSTEYKADVRSDTEWSGAFGNRTVDGDGNRMISLGSETPVCCVVQKQTEEGYLQVQVIAEGGWWIFKPDDGDVARTTADYGVVTACSVD